ncbi:MAG: methionyl-tRNA formyltransferase [Candidatus Dojkabacteria bacterium]|nr:methionyl-tRNA formyltransferase [Candidatus Dojkabacteria bacterium]
MRDLIKEPIKTVFLGTGWESVETLKILHKDSRFDIVAVITTVDKPVGRKQILTQSDVKKYALENSIPVVHTEKKVEKYTEFINTYKPELAVCKAFGEIVPKEFLDYPKYKCINIHFSLLPKYRGAVPIQKAILDGEEKTGISIMLMSEGLDEGEILAMYEEEILPDDTNQTLRERLVKKSASVLIDVLISWINGDIQTKPQEGEPSYCWQKDISKENAKIEWSLYTAEYIERMIRAFIPWPVAWFNAKNLNDRKIKIFKAQIVDCREDKEIGELFVKDNQLLIKTKDRFLRILELQIEGGKITNEKEFINGIGRNLT